MGTHHRRAALPAAVIGGEMLYSESRLSVSGRPSLIENMQRAFKELKRKKRRLRAIHRN
jgi:hypothetical protein